MKGCGLVSKPGFVKRWVQEIAAGVTGEHPAGTVGTMRAGRQANDHDLCVGVAKAGNRFSPVVLILISPAFCDGHLFPPGNQARAFPAGSDFIFEFLE